jgi:hypothetical protein
MFVRYSHANVSTFSASVSARGVIFLPNVSWAGAMFVRRRRYVFESLQVTLGLANRDMFGPTLCANTYVRGQRLPQGAGYAYGQDRPGAPRDDACSEDDADVAARADRSRADARKCARST